MKSMDEAQLIHGTRRRTCHWRAIVMASTCWLFATIGVLGQAGTPEPMPPPDSAARDYGPVAAHKQYRFALLIPLPDDAFWQEVREAVKERAAADGVTVDVFDLLAPSVPEQLNQLDDVIRNQYDAVLIGPIDAAGIVPGITAANEAGIPVLAIDTAPYGGEVVSVVRTDGVAAGRLAGNFTADAIGGEGAVLDLQGDLANPVAHERERGFRDALAAFPKIEVVAHQGDWSFNSAQALTDPYLPRGGTPAAAGVEISGIVAANDQMALGAAQAVDEAQADEVVVVGIGATTDTLSAIRDGILAATVAEFPTRAGAIAVDLMVLHLNGDSVPAMVDSGSAVVTRATIDQFLRKSGHGSVAPQA